MSFVMEFTGLSKLLLFFSLMQKVQDFGEAWVGSAVIYGPYQEFGTLHMTSRPHWRPAIAEVVAELGGDERLQNQILDALAVELAESGEFEEFQLDPADNAPLKVALMIERRVKQIITAKHIIETSNYRGSIATGREEFEAFENSAAKVLDPDTVAGS